jgi:hypothetical protein
MVQHNSTVLKSCYIKKKNQPLFFNVTDNVTEKRLKFILDLIKQNNQITTTEIAKKNKSHQANRITRHRKIKKKTEQNPTDR